MATLTGAQAEQFVRDQIAKKNAGQALDNWSFGNSDSESYFKSMIDSEMAKSKQAALQNPDRGGLGNFLFDLAAPARKLMGQVALAPQMMQGKSAEDIYSNQNDPLVKALLNFNEVQKMQSDPLSEGAKNVAGVAGMVAPFAVGPLGGLGQRMAAQAGIGAIGNLSNTNSASDIPGLLAGGAAAGAGGELVGSALGAIGGKLAGKLGQGELPASENSLKRLLFEGVNEKNTGLIPKELRVAKSAILKDMADSGMAINGSKDIADNLPKLIENYTSTVNKLAQDGAEIPGAKKSLIETIANFGKDPKKKLSLGQSLINEGRLVEVKAIINGMPDNPSPLKLVELNRKLADIGGGYESLLDPSSAQAKQLLQKIRGVSRNAISTNPELSAMLNKENTAIKVNDTILGAIQKQDNVGVTAGLKGATFNVRPLKEKFISAIDNAPARAKQFGGSTNSIVSNTGLAGALTSRGMFNQAPQSTTQSTPQTAQGGQSQQYQNIPMPNDLLASMSGGTSGQTSGADAGQLAIQLINGGMKPTDAISLAKLLGTSSTGSGKQLPAASVKDLADTKEAMSQIDNLQTMFNQSSDVFNPIMGNIRAANLWDGSAQNAKAVVALAKQIVGKGLEGGVLRKEDEEKYKQILPQLGETSETVQNKLDLLKKTLENKLQTKTDTYQQAGYNPSFGVSSADNSQGGSQSILDYLNANQ